MEPGVFSVDLTNVQTGELMENIEFHVVAVGPLEVGQTLYPWAIITDRSGQYMFILARYVTEFNTKHEQAALLKAQQLGLTSTVNMPIKTYQSTLCQYPPRTPIS